MARGGAALRFNSVVLAVTFASVGIDDYERHVRQDSSLMRPADVLDLYGDPTKAEEQLGWAPTVGLDEVVAHMVRVDVERLRSGVEESPAYLFPAGTRRV